jgi:hypothetical protein
MKGYFSILFVCIVSLSAFSDCNGNDRVKDSPNPTTPKLIIDDSSYGIPKREPTKEQILIENRLGIKHLTNGMNGQEYRIWGGPPLSDTLKLFLIKKEGSTYISNLYTIAYDMNKQRDSFLYFRFTVQNLSPKTSWEILIKRIKDLNLISLPDYMELPGYKEELPSDAEGVLIEALQDNKYNSALYQEVAYFSKKYSDAKKVNNFVQLVEKEMNIKLE